jgi:putative ABC transport system permease protein
MLDLLVNAAAQASVFGIGAIGVALSFRVARYPDLTADGSFMLGGAAFAAAAGAGVGWLGAAACAAGAGVAAGVLTSVISERLGLTRLLSGILTTMICYSLAFRLLDGSPNSSLVPFLAERSLQQSAAGYLLSLVPVILTCLVVSQILRSQLGLVLRATGSNPALVSALGRSPSLYITITLGLANGLIALAAATVSIQQQFVDLNLGVGVVITFLSAILLGEGLLRLLPKRVQTPGCARALAPVIGCLMYFLLYLLVLRASLRDWIPINLQPADLKLLSAVLLIVLAATHRRKGESDPPL